MLYPAALGEKIAFVFYEEFVGKLDIFFGFFYEGVIGFVYIFKVLVLIY